MTKPTTESTIEKHVFGPEPFTTLMNEPIQKKIKKMEILGLWCYLMSLPPDWQINTFQLAKHFGINRRTMQQRIGILIDMGYAASFQARENGRLKQIKYYAFKEQLTKSKYNIFKKRFLSEGILRAVFLGAEKQPHTKEIRKQKKISKKQTTRARIDGGNVHNPEPAPRPPDRSLFPSKKKKEPLDPFDPKQSYFKGLTNKEVACIRKEFDKQAHNIRVPEAWITAFIKKGYHRLDAEKDHVATQMTEHEERKQQFAPKHSKRPRKEGGSWQTLSDMLKNLSVGERGFA